MKFKYYFGNLSFTSKSVYISSKNSQITLIFLHDLQLSILHILWKNQLVWSKIEPSGSININARDVVLKNCIHHAFFSKFTIWSSVKINYQHFLYSSLLFAFDLSNIWNVKASAQKREILFHEMSCDIL